MGVSETSWGLDFKTIPGIWIWSWFDGGKGKHFVAFLTSSIVVSPVGILYYYIHFKHFHHKIYIDHWLQDVLSCPSTLFVHWSGAGWCENMKHPVLTEAPDLPLVSDPSHSTTQPTTPPLSMSGVFSLH